MTAPLIYVAAPYHHPDPAVIAARMEAFDEVIANMLLAGRLPVSPLLFHPLYRQHPVPGTWDFFGRYSLALLDRCDEMVIITIPGWAESTGVTAETEHARAKGIPVRDVHFSRQAYERGLAKGLGEEFPTLRLSAVESVLLNANGDVNRARERMARLVTHFGAASVSISEV